MSDAALLHAERMARGEESYQGKLLEARQNDFKDEIVLIIISAPIIVLAWGVFSDDALMMEKIDLFFIKQISYNNKTFFFKKVKFSSSPFSSSSS